MVDVQGLTEATAFRTGAGKDTLARDSAIVVDVDRREARALLFEVVDGAARFVGFGVGHAASGKADAIAAAITASLRHLEHGTGRRFLEGDSLITPQQSDGNGVDVYYVTGAPTEPARAALISVGNGALGRQVVSGVRRTPTVLADAHEDLRLTGASFAPNTLATWLRAIQPATIILIHEGGTAEEWDIALEAITEEARDGRLTNGIVVADDAHQQSAAQSLGSMLELSGINPSDYATWEIALALEAEFRDQFSRAIEANEALKLFSTATFVDRIQATQAVAAFLHRRMSRNVLTISIGDGSLLHSASRLGGVTVARVDRDFGYGARSLLRIAPERIARWLPFRWSNEEITQWLLNRALRPALEPEAATDLLVDAAVRRELIADLMQEAGLANDAEIDLITLGPSACLGDDGLALLTVLDGVMPRSADGLVTVAQDIEGLTAAVGSISTKDAVFASEVIEQDFLTPLATCIIVDGRGEDGALAVRGEIGYASGETRRFSVPFGSIQLLPLADGESADVTLAPEPGFRIGNRNGDESVSFTGDRQVFGGKLGVVIDARGRPVHLPDEPEMRASRLRAWLSDVGSQVQ